MNINITDVDKLKNDVEFNNFISNNSGMGTLKIRANSINEALPVENVKIIVEKKIGNNNIIFFEGYTDKSGMINNIKLPTPKRIISNLEIPNFTTYEIIAEYKKDDFLKKYNISLCCGAELIQYINIIPKINIERFDMYGN